MSQRLKARATMAAHTGKPGATVQMGAPRTPGVSAAPHVAYDGAQMNMDGDKLNSVAPVAMPDPDAMPPAPTTYKRGGQVC